MSRQGGIRSRIAAASGWIGSALEYYDFFIYATAASLVFPQIFFPSNNPTVAIVASLATYGVGYVARPIGAFVLGHWGDTHGRKNVMLVCLFLMGFSTMAVGIASDLSAGGGLGADPARHPAAHSGICGRRRNLRRELDDSRARVLRPARLFRELHAARRAGGADSGGGGLPALELCAAERRLQSWGWRVPFLLSVVVLIAGYMIRREVEETPAFAEERAHRDVPKTPVMDALTNHWPDMLRVVCMSLMNVIPVVATIFGAAYAVQPGYGVGMDRSVYLWIPVIGNIVAVIVIPFVGDLSDRIGRRPPIIVGSLAAGLLSFAYLYAISIRNVPVAFVISILMWGIVYQGYNAVFPSFYPELFPTRARVSGMAIAQNIGTMLTALLPALFATVAPPGSTHVPMTIGALAFLVTVISSVAAWSARETYRVHLNDLGEPGASAVEKAEYDRLRQQSVASAA